MTSTLQLEPCPTPALVAERCADLVQRCLAEHTEPVLLVPAGNTPVLLFAELVLRHKRGELDLGKAHLFQLDELVGVPPKDPRSFQRFVRDQLQTPLSLSEDRLHLLDGTAPDPVAEIERHASTLRELGEAHLALLGIGQNGHVAFNEPGSSKTLPARLVHLAEPTLAGLRGSFEEHEVPTQGITLGIFELYAASEVALLATGRSKAGILSQLVSAPSSDELPASHFRDHPSFHIFHDEDAGSQLSGGATAY